MGGHKIDAGVRLAAAARVQIARASYPIREFADQTAVPLPIRANNVTILVVPLCPANRKFADLISAFAKIPGFGDELYLREDRILMNDVEKCAKAIDFVQLACEGRRQIEAETVNVHFQDPITQAVHDQLQHTRMTHVECVASARVVHVIAWIIWN